MYTFNIFCKACLTICLQVYSQHEYCVLLSGACGIAKPWYFPFSPQYWCGVRPHMSTWSPKRLFGIHKVYRLHDEALDDEMLGHGK